MRTPGRCGTTSRHPPRAGSVSAEVSADVVVGRGHDPEVFGAVVGQCDEPPRILRPPGEMVHGVLDPFPSWHHDLGRVQRGPSGDGEPLGRVGAVEPDEDAGQVAAVPGAEREAAVAFLDHEDVRRGVRAEAVTPELVRALGVVHAHVEDEAAVARPGQAVAGLGHRFGCGGGGHVGVQGPEAQRVSLVARVVGRIRQPAVIVAHRSRPQGEVLGAGGGGERVLVQDDLLLVARLGGGRQFAGAVRRPPAVEGVVLPLLGAGEVPPGAPAGRDRHVGLLDPGLHLLEELCAERVERGQRGVGVVVLGPQVLEDGRVLAVAQPEPEVLAVVPVGRDHVGPPGGLRGRQRRWGWRRAHGGEPATGEAPGLRRGTFRQARAVVTI